MKKIPEVTIAVSAYNEEKNIKNFLESLLVQKEFGFVLKSIWVLSDGSKDRTVEFAKSFKSKKIKVFDYKDRLGKSSRLNQIYAKLKSDILVQSDADVLFAHPYVIYDVIQPLLKNKRVGMCGGNPQPLKAKTFTEKAVNNTVFAYLPLRESVRGGNNIFSVDGRLLAYKKALIKQIYVPEDMIANDAFTYFECLVHGYEYRFVKDAFVNFRSPQNIKDQIRQVTRFKAARIRMFRHFPKDLVTKEQYIPASLLIKNMLVQFVKHPIHCSYIFLVNKFCKYQALKNESKLNSTWEIALTSKNLS
ncbi:hypothetical protein A2962_03200 [Candidatus Woesebacteria bacterium RIFCSPLOWO2_01_FULL_39_61]|uniref:Glycosyltransferase 2-like domain-containing protein n=1 Tax=Candidatus Woesebacteria bacterium RIFCSPHIGHO2_02_FULL_39_13 TaxID=1802505 RepID=A0A1F7Z316_9BACT|nr:MAG: hypothetical protein A2692_04285 [Candidatus Woesebacteria bacterium RIFCSPHIGHO2_01_FULL_39_95]OGM33830.1 MAG: hypothetical protein A3D01_02570 [Candidatus Woesebacteria bacterium RIFCSPHIGHO2_02_FULL_39_13]OGM38991.1 MAG: hypothetical protein A3E13_04840 [Candidatus Woesebacteria bacterium RIFCSPHIGHO2_12_FULL_40_20]OGM67496.1 MAG: hypothetical protein A2962_03200 [Candidatus Woesebacteria bacterium RIFCSPLOWO2_01_FULL_39_61]OGM72827.1 MAG: hypothetical protein A3H19_05705 [Candidatus